ncbi:MAG: UDP-N-acetyl-alpha-D-muramoyl-L-alanyl-L-glutamate epimerase [Pseudomarimonas sp.]
MSNPRSSSHVFKRDEIACFRFVRTEFCAKSGLAKLVYAFDDGPELIETIRVPGAPFDLSVERVMAVEAALRLLHMIAGVSYFKAAVPKTIRIDGYAIDADTASVLSTVYENGLAEFAYRNGLSLRGKIRFPAVAADRPIALARTGENTPRRALVAIGGGKDSLVSIEALRALGMSQTVTWIGAAPLIRACAERTGLPLLQIERQLAAQLFEFNRAGAWNGHIPVTAINSAILVFAALLVGADSVVFSNERSASYGSQIEGTGEVNHQWSKGWDFERLFAAEVRRTVASHFSYFSLLRPLSELAVARQFARLNRYDAHFSSCNRNFHLLGERPASRWCGVCPKCHFVFLALAPFMPKPRLVAIFGRNLLDEAEQAAGFDALIEYRDHKPFECVGEGRESRAALATLSQSPVWREDALVARFTREILPQLDPAELTIAPQLVAQGEHGIPAELWSRLDAHFSA